MAAPKTIVISITNAWGIRNYIHTGLLRRLAAGARVAVATTAHYEEAVGALCGDFVVQVLRLPDAPETMLERTLRRFRKLLFQRLHRVATERIKSAAQRLTWRAALRGRLQDAVGDALASHWLIAACGRADLALAPAPALLEALRALAPDLIVNGSPFDFRDCRVLRAARVLGVPSLAVIPSWDNPSSKGVLHTCYAGVLVWGEVQRAEIARFYPQFDPAAIAVVGIPQFDAYAEALPPAFAEAPFRSRHGIAAGAAIVLLSSSSEKLTPHEPAVARHLGEAAAAGAFGRAVHVLVRCHPDDRAERFEQACRGLPVTVVAPAKAANDNLYQWLPAAEETAGLAAMIKHAVVVVNTASTMTLDAIACGRPVINIAYDGDRSDVAAHAAAARYYGYTHFLPVVASGAVPLARSREQLIGMVGAAIADPARLGAERSVLYRDLCGVAPGQVIDRFVGVLHGAL